MIPLTIPKQLKGPMQKPDVTIARRSFLKGAGMLVVSFGVAVSPACIAGAARGLSLDEARAVPFMLIMSRQS